MNPKIDIRNEGVEVITEQSTSKLKLLTSELCLNIN